MDCTQAKCLMLSLLFLFPFLCAWSAANAEGEIIFRIDPLGKQNVGERESEREGVHTRSKDMLIKRERERESGDA